jgi:hypothetical protein
MKNNLFLFGFHQLGEWSFTWAFIWNVRGLLFDVPKGFAGISHRRETVQQEFYSSYCNSILSQIEKQREASDEIIVALKFL